MDQKCIRIDDKHYVNLEEDIHIATTVRMKRDCLIKPQTAVVCYGKVKENPDLPVGRFMKSHKLIRVSLLIIQVYELLIKYQHSIRIDHYHFWS